MAVGKKSKKNKKIETVKKKVAKTVAKAPSKKALTKKAPVKSAPVKKAPVKSKVVAKKTAPKEKAPAPKAPKSFAAKVKAAVKATVDATTSVVEKFLHPDVAEALTPLDDRILVHVQAAPEKTTGGLYIPGTTTTKQTRGKVVAIGRGRRSKKGAIRPLDVKVGDYILFPEFAGQAVTVKGTELLILREEDVLGVSEF